LPRPTDNVDRPSTLPPPELNPLMNPILGQNMGRWAEVYFTSAPEKREEAVLALLRELQAESLQEDKPAASLSNRNPVSMPTAPPAFKTEQDQAALVRCESCGRENPPQHRFCGMCGTLLGTEGTAVDSRADESRDDRHLLEPAVSTLNLESDFFRGKTGGERATSGSPPVAATMEVSRGDDVDLAPAFTRFPRSYRLYVGSALALLIIALVYVAWRSGQATSQATGLPAPTPTVATASRPAQTAPTPKTDNSGSADGSQTPVSHGAEQPTPGKVRPEPIPVKETQAAPSPATPVAKVPEAQPALEGGAKELTIAESYLNGTNGQQRDTGLAAQWLWRAVAKGNASATLQLSDLYLIGDGVAKNCDQARVLLGAAANKGMKQAEERLRDLQSFGCK